LLTWQPIADGFSRLSLGFDKIIPLFLLLDSMEAKFMQSASVVLYERRSWLRGVAE
jgi:hypothetical protein